MSKKIMVKLSRKKFNILKVLYILMLVLLAGLIALNVTSKQIFPKIQTVWLFHILYWIWMIAFPILFLIFFFGIFIPNFLNIFSSYKRYSRKIDKEIELENFDTKYWYQEKTIYLD